MAKAKRCKVCPNKDQTRGLCTNHRDDARAVIAAGLATDAELVEAGLMAPKKPLGRPAKKKRRQKTAPVLEGNLIWQRLQEMQVDAT